MDSCDIRTIMEIMAEHLDVDIQDISMEATFESLGADKLDVIELIMAVEEEFDCEIPAIEERYEVSTIGEFLQEIEPYL